MTAAVTSAACRTQLTVENVLEAVLQALATQAPAAPAFAGMREFERGTDSAWKSIQPSEQSLRAKRKTKRALRGNQTTACAEGRIRQINLHAHCT